MHKGIVWAHGLQFGSRQFWLSSYDPIKQLNLEYKQKNQQQNVIDSPDLDKLKL
jgi:hypothetical protein